MAKKIMTLLYQPGDISLDVRFSEQKGLFSIVYMNRTYEDTVFQTLKDTVFHAIKQSFDLVWIPIIELSTQTSYSTTNGVSLYLQIDRKHVADHKQLGRKSVYWGCPPESRLQASTTFYCGTHFSFPCVREGTGTTYVYLPYKDSTWTHLQEIRKYFQVAAQGAAQRLTSLEGIEELLTISHSLFDHFATRNDEIQEESECQ